MKSALRSLQDKGLISIRRPYARCKVGNMLLNIVGITAVHARDHRNTRNLELHWTARDIIQRVGGVFRCHEIFHEPVPGVLPEPMPKELHLGVHAALGNREARVKVMGQWSSAPCPLALKTHDGGVDDHPSFELYLDEEGSFLYKCWACGDGEARPLSHLFTRMQECFGEFPLQAHRMALAASRLVKLGAIDASIAQTEALGSELERYPFLTRFTKGATGFLKNYLRSRGLRDAAYEHFSVRYLPVQGTTNRVPKTLVTEYTLRDGAVVAIRLRTVVRKSRRFATVGSLRSALFGLARADLTKPLLVVEGEIDAMCSYSFGFVNVVATGSANRSALALANVLKLWGGEKVYLGLDCDTAGQGAQSRLIEALKAHVPDLYAVDWSQIALPTPIHTDTGARLTCKDAGDIPTTEQFWRVIKNADLVQHDLGHQGCMLASG